MVVAVVLAAATAVTQALVLGLVDLGASPVALPLAAVATWLAARALVPAAGPGLAEQAAARWRSLPRSEQVLLGVLAGAWLAWSAWLVRYPALGIDSIAYHLPEVVSWVHEGNPGAVVTVLPGFATSNFPLTNEVLVAWSMGISRSFLPAAVWAPLFIAILACAGWSALRAVAVPRLTAGLAVAAVCAAPMLTSYAMNGVHTDLPTLAWLACCAALCAASRERPALLAVAFVAGGLAVGTKTTTAPLVLVCLVLGFVAARGRLRPLAWPLTAGVLGAAVTGLVWPLRNLIEHGSPLWPHFAAPWGDPTPEVMARAVSFIERPVETLDRLGDDYLDLFGGGFLIMVAALVVPLLARSRAVTWAAVATGVSAVLWTASPTSGVSENPLLDAAPLSTLRYLTPALAAGAVTLALAARRPGRARVFAIGALATGLAVELLQSLDLGFPRVPAALTPLTGALAGAVVALVLLRAGHPPRPRALAAGMVMLAVVTGAVLGLAAPGFGERHARAGLYDAEIIRFLSGLDGYESGDRTIAMSPVLAGPVAGDSIQHRLALLPRTGGCARLLAGLRGEWVVLHENPLSRVGPSPTRACFKSRPASHRGRTFSFYELTGPAPSAGG